jgi:WD40 repeat protein
MTPLLLTAALLQPAPPLDAYGDPLPPGALFRLGSARLHPGGPTAALGFTPDGKKLVSVSYAGLVHHWDVATGKELAEVRLPSPYPQWFVLAPDATLLAVLDNRGVCSVRSTATGAELFRFNEPNQPDVQVAFAPDGKTLAVIKPAGKLTVEVRSLTGAKGTVLRTLPLGDGLTVEPCFAFAADGRSFVMAAAAESWVDRYDYATGEQLTRIKTVVSAIALSPDGKLLAGREGFHDVDYMVWDAATGKQLRSFNGGYTPNKGPIMFLADGLHVISDQGARAVMWHALAGKKVRSFGGHNVLVTGLAVSPDGATLATCDEGTIRLWDVKTGKPLHEEPPHRGHGVTVRFSPDGKRLLTTSPGDRSDTGRAAREWDATTGKPLARIPLGAHPVFQEAVSADGRVIAAEDDTGQIHITNVNGKVLLKVAPRDGACLAADLSPDGRLLLLRMGFLVGEAETIHIKLQLWDVASNRQLVEVSEDGRTLLGRFDEAGRTLLVLRGSRGDREVSCYDAATGRALPRSTVQAVAADALARSPDGWLLAHDEPLRYAVVLRELSTGHRLGELDLGGHRARALAFHPAGRLLAAGTAEGPILVFDVATGQQVASLAGHRGGTTSVAWSLDGKRLASGGNDLTALVWDAAPWLDAPHPAAAPTAAQQGVAWVQLAADDAAQALAAVRRLAQSPAATTALLKDRLKPPGPEELARLAALVAQLGDPKYAVREKAAAELLRTGDAAAAFLKQAREEATAPEVRQRLDEILRKLAARPPDSGSVRQRRALAVLTLLGTPEARALLEALAAGDEAAWLTGEARRALGRPARNSE